MAGTLSSAAKAPVSANNGTGEGRHAYAENGAIRLLQFGRVETVSRWDAIAALIDVDDSPFPSSQERARQIRAALKETMQ